MKKIKIDVKEIVNRIKLCMEERNLKEQVDLAILADIAPDRINRLFNGEIKSPSADMLGAIAIGLNVSVDYLLYGNNATVSLAPFHYAPMHQTPKQLLKRLEYNVMREIKEVQKLWEADEERSQA